MTDNEIIKACKNCLHYEACKGTYYSAKGDEDILHDFDGEMYANSGCEGFEDKDHINRKKAEIESNKAKIKISAECIARQDKEIERLKTELKEDSRTMKQALVLLDELKQDIANDITTAKAEAVKEFADRLKEYVESYDVTTGYKVIIVNAVEEETIDNLVKEMVGE